MFRKILVANRGEIAVRVIRACKELGVSTATVYSEADVESLHTRYADECYLIGSADPQKSYLNIERMLEVAGESECEAVHPGYGFLSQIPAFAVACKEAGLEFIGPPSSVLLKMGNKVDAKRTATDLGVPVIPGGEVPAQSLEEAVEQAEQLGFPVLVKAVYGGGGKGMRIVNGKAEMQRALELVMMEAETSFGDRQIYIEKLLQRTRHIEFQILADKRGRFIHLGERECSIQRRYQKLIEEAPSPFMTEELRKEIGKAAIRIAKAVTYVGAGTVEFLVDLNQDFHFLEMNTRLQVEHLVTEMTTGVDIVKAQIKIAAGQKIEHRQSDIKVNGHALNCRINAEDPHNNFMPCPGTVTAFHQPGGPGVRVDTHLYSGYSIPAYYDSLIVKLAVLGSDRREATRKMQNALEEFIIEGVKTTIPFHKKIMQDRCFLKGEIHTTFIEERLDRLLPEQELDEEEIAAAIAALADYIGPGRSKAVIPKRKARAISMWKFAARTRRSWRK